jgi:uncharacterized protein YdhG (YjbR/CyaY superfamily)
MARMKKASADIDGYIRAFPKPVQAKLRQLKSIVAKAAPQAAEKISYGMPTFYLNGNLVHFAAHARHIGFYPTPSAIEAFGKELAKYQSSKGAVQFPTDEPLPADLIRRMVAFRVKESTSPALTRDDQRALARWAADCAGHVLRRFEERYPDDDRPRRALAAARAWARGEIRTGEARNAALAAHASARDADDAAARAAARAAGHAAATAHVAGHAGGAADYAIKAAVEAAKPGDAAAAAAKEREWQRRRGSCLRSIHGGMPAAHGAASPIEGAGT